MIDEHIDTMVCVQSIFDPPTRFSGKTHTALAASRSMERFLKCTGDTMRPWKRPRRNIQMFETVSVTEPPLGQVHAVQNNCLPQESPICCVDYDADGTYLATSSKDASHIYNVKTGKHLRQFSSPGRGYTRSLRFSRDDTCLITSFETPVAQVHDIASGRVKLFLHGHNAAVYSVDVCPRNHFIATASGDGKTILWRENSGQILTSLVDDTDGTLGVTSVSVSPCGKLVATASLDSVVRVWDAELGVILRKLTGHTDVAYSVVFSPDGKALLSGSLDRTLKMWDVTAPNPPGKCVLSLEGHQEGVLSTRFSPNGSWLFSASMDRSVRMWDPRKSKSMFALQGFNGSVMSVVHSPKGQYIATGSGDSIARTWSYSAKW